MSFEAMAWAIKQTLRNPTKSVLFMLAYRDNHEPPHGCYPALKTIAFDCGISTATVKRCLIELQESRLVVREQRTSPVSGDLTTRYSMPGAWDDTVAQREPPSGSERAKASVPVSLPRGSDRATEPKEVFNLKEEPKNKNWFLLAPGWAPTESWNGWIEMRRAKKYPLTERAISLAAKALVEIHKETGQTYESLLDCATLRGWRGIFPVPEGPTNGNGYKQESFDEKLARNNEAVIRSVAQRRSHNVVGSLPLQPQREDR